MADIFITLGLLLILMIKLPYLILCFTLKVIYLAKSIIIATILLVKLFILKLLTAKEYLILNSWRRLYSWKVKSLDTSPQLILIRLHRYSVMIIHSLSVCFRCSIKSSYRVQVVLVLSLNSRVLSA